MTRIIVTPASSGNDLSQRFVKAINLTFVGHKGWAASWRSRFSVGCIISTFGFDVVTKDSEIAATGEATLKLV